MTKQKQLERFITDNGLTFAKGSRNSNSVVLSGYAMHIEVGEITVLINAVDAAVEEPDDYMEELTRVFEYAQKNNYNKYWEGEEAKKLYKF